MEIKNQYIRADKLKERFLIVAQSGGPVVVHVSDICAAIDDELFETDADVAEVAHGKWIDMPEVREEMRLPEAYRCSVCGKSALLKHNFCNRCGSKMDGGCCNGL